MATTQCTCGTLLPPPDAAGLVTCPSCGRVTRADVPDAPDAAAPQPPQPPAGAPGEGSAAWPAPPVAAPLPSNQWAPPSPVAGAPSTPPPTNVAPSGSPKVRKIGCSVVPAIIGVIVVGVFISLLRSCDTNSVVSKINPNVSGFEDTITLSGTTNVLSSSPESLIVGATTQTSGGGSTVRRLSKIRFDGSGSKVLWQSEDLGSSTSRVEVAQVGDTTFAATEDRLYALDGTGKTRWSTDLHDKVTNGCPDCFASIGGKLIVRTIDGYVAAYDPASSEPAWTKRLRSPSGSVSVASGHLLVVDAPEDDKAVTPVQLVDPATGKVVRSTSPTCPKPADSIWDVEMNPGDRVLSLAGSRDVVAVFGFGDACVVRWDPGSGTVKWTSRINGASSVDADKVLVGPTQILVPTSSQAMAAIDIRTGQARVLEGIADLQVEPNTIVGTTLLADVASTRGTPQHGLAAFDLTTGKKLWANTRLGTAAPVTRSSSFNSDALFDGAPRSLVVVDGGKASVVVFDGTSHTFSVRPVDLKTGALGAEVRRAFASDRSGTPSITIESVADGRILMTLDSLLQSLPVSGRGEITTFPEQN